MALTEVIGRDFAKKLGLEEKRFLRNLTNRLLDEGSLVHEVLQTFSRSLRTFVQSREYLATFTSGSGTDLHDPPF